MLLVDASCKPKRCSDEPEKRRCRKHRACHRLAEQEYRRKGCGNRDRISPRAGTGEAAQARPLEAAGHENQRDQRREPGLRQQEQCGEKCRDQRGRGGGPRSERAAPAASARFCEVEEAATCSLVRPKRRSRLRYEPIALSSAAAAK